MEKQLNFDQSLVFSFLILTILLFLLSLFSLVSVV